MPLCCLGFVLLLASGCAQAPPADKAGATQAAPQKTPADEAPEGVEPLPKEAPAAPAALKGTKPAPSATATGTPKAAPPIADAKAQGAQAPLSKEERLSMNACKIVCEHVLRLSLQALPDDAPATLREEHKQKLAKECPPGCMREGTPATNNCILKATTIQEAAACQS